MPTSNTEELGRFLKCTVIGRGVFGPCACCTHPPSGIPTHLWDTYRLLVTSGGNHWRPVQTCSFENLLPPPQQHLVECCLSCYHCLFKYHNFTNRRIFNKKYYKMFKFVVKSVDCVNISRINCSEFICKIYTCINK